MNHALVKLSRTIDCSFVEERFCAIYEVKPGRPPLQTRLMAGLAILKHTYDLSDEVLCERWLENSYYQFFSSPARSSSSMIWCSIAQR